MIFFGSFSNSNFYEFYNAMKTLQQEFWQNIYNFFKNIAHGIGKMESNHLVTAERQAGRRNNSVLCCL